MKSNEARQLLEVYRPSGADAQDPQIQEALKQADRDPALAGWFEEQKTRNLQVLMSRQWGRLESMWTHLRLPSLLKQR